MIQHLIYKCPKCHNTLLVSNKMLHDLRCTEDNPATYENVLRQSKIPDDNVPPSYYQDNSSSQYSNSMRKSNGDGTTSDIKKSINLNGIRNKWRIASSKYSEKIKSIKIENKKADKKKYKF